MKKKIKRDITSALPTPTHLAISITTQYENVAPDSVHRTAVGGDDDEYYYENGQFLDKFN